MEPITPTEVRGKRNSRELAEPVSMPPESDARCKVDFDDMLGLVGIVSTVLNLLVVVLVYVYTPV